MTYIVPKIDQRSQQDVADEIRRLILEYCPEYFTNDINNKMNTDEIKSDKQAEALIQIFSTMMGHVIDTLNQSPEKNYTAFLNMIGISPTAPKASKAPIQFKLKKDWEKEVYIPAGTKISAQPDNKKEVIFETENDLIVIRPELTRAACVEPGTDQWRNLDFLLLPENKGEYAEIFNGNTQILHRIYIGHSIFQNMKEAVLDLSLTLNTGNKKDYEVEWFYFDDKGNPQHFCSSKDGIEKPSSEEEKKYIYFQSGSAKFPDLSVISSKVLSGYDKSGLMNTWNSNFIYAELKTPIDSTGEKVLPEITDISMTFSKPLTELPLDAAVSNYSKVDLTKDFYPFGERPVFNDTFYIACREAFSKVDANIEVHIDLTKGNAPDTKNIILSWEYWNGIRWIELGSISKITTYTIEKSKGPDGSVVEKKIENKPTVSISGGIIEDTTEVFTHSGYVKFKSPSMVPLNVNGEENYWIRVRITGGDYGKDGFVDYVDKNVDLTAGNSVSLKQVAYTPPSFNPPLLQSLTIKYSYTLASKVPEVIITENNFVMSAIADNTKKMYTKGYSFKPFIPCDDEDPAFYLAFDSDISNLPLSLFFPLFGDQAGLSGSKAPVVGWEYWNGRRWLTLSVNDAIRDFTRREIQQITIPADIEKRALFGDDYYWIRARLEGGGTGERGYKVAPKINAVYSNVVWAENSNTIKNETVGSSNGEPSQSFQLSCSPVLNGQIVKVHETLGREEWIEWEEVQTFSLSNTDSRHYMLDSQSGTLVFGDGKNGMIPPAGTDNIQCDYNYGGGTVGNVEENSITKIWDNFIGIESVCNPVAADGGFDQEDIEDAKARGPHTLKNRDRGVTCEDVEWLVREAAPQIAIVKCFPTMNTDLDFAAGEATVIIVPEYKDPKPAPSQELLNEIDEYLSERISTVLHTDSGTKLNVIGPDYVRVGVEAEVKYSTEFGKIVEGAIIDNLKQFLDPLSGGQERKGWSLGKNLYISEICSEIKKTPGVDFIKSININSSVQCYALYLEQMQDGPFKPVLSYPTYSAVKTSDNRIVFALAQKLQANKGVKALSVRGFREKETLTLRYRNYCSQPLIVISVEGDVLECSTADQEPLAYTFTGKKSLNEPDKVYPIGSDVEAVVTEDLTIRSFIMNEITGTPKTFFIKIAIPEMRDTVYLSRNDEYNNNMSLKIKEVRSEDIFLEEDELVYSGIHLINKKPQLKFPYLMNNDTQLVHDLSYENPQCCLADISKEDRKYMQSIDETADYKLCGYCFDSEKTLINCYIMTVKTLSNEPFEPSEAYDIYSLVRSQDNRIVLSLAKKLDANKTAESLWVIGFSKNDKVTLRFGMHSSKVLTITSVEGNMLECQTSDGSSLDMDYPVGSVLEKIGSANLTICSYILNEITGNKTSFFVKIAIPDTKDTIYLSGNGETSAAVSLSVNEIKNGQIFI
jgi:hypothetical protein